jgi:hypothetical protein
MCGNEVLNQHASPNGKLKLVVFERSCGATTGFSTQVSLLEASEELENEGGNVFAGDTRIGAAPAGAGGGPEVHVRWISDEAAELRHHPQTRIFRAEEVRKGVRFIYKWERGESR